MTSEFILRARALKRDFLGFTAVDGVDLDVRRGSVHALIGPNGAGKTTCFNLLTRFLPVSSGTIEFDGTDITNMSAAQVARRKLARSFQISAVFPEMTVLQNVCMALQSSAGDEFSFWRSTKRLAPHKTKAFDLIEQVNLSPFANRLAGSLPYGRKRALELATTLALDPKVMLLDEPTAGMTASDVHHIIELIGEVSKGRTILMVEHNLSVVERLCDTVTVLARGKVVIQGSYAQISNSPEVISAYLGEEIV